MMKAYLDCLDAGLRSLYHGFAVFSGPFLQKSLQFNAPPVKVAGSEAAGNHPRQATYRGAGPCPSPSLGPLSFAVNSISPLLHAARSLCVMLVGAGYPFQSDHGASAIPGGLPSPQLSVGGVMELREVPPEVDPTLTADA